MHKIKILDKKTSDKIAAGEVILSPFSVVKELVENSIDAEAKRITVEITEAGKQLIKVSDDGIGIDKEDINTAFQKHSTSKISNEDDIDNINSYGFRGEALGSISAVSKLSLISKPLAQKVGRKIIITGGTVVSEEDVSMEQGTQVSVLSLFYNIPARKKFLKSNSAEASKIINYIIAMAIVRSDIIFKMISDGKILFVTNGKSDRLLTLKTLWGNDIVNPVFKTPVFEREEIRLTGFLSPPNHLFKTKKQQLFFVNGRKISSALIESAVRESYSSFIFKKEHPLALLFIDIPPNKLDVNVHPSKLEIRFNDEMLVKDFIISSIKQYLMDRNTLYQGDEFNLPNTNKNEVCDEKKFEYGRENILKERNDLLNDQAEKKEGSTSGQEYIDKTILDDPNDLRKDGMPSQKTLFDENFNISQLMPIDQIFGGFILAKDMVSLYIIDQHAMHERINFEKMLNNIEKKNIEVQRLMIPEILTIPSYLILEMQDIKSTLNDIGFEAEVFGEDKIKVDAVPVLNGFDYRIFLKDFVDNYSSTSNIIDENVLERIISNACKSSIKLGDKITLKEINGMIDEISRCKQPFTCPHGRPIFVGYSKENIEKMFKRKG